MKDQFSIEFIIDVAIILVIVMFMLLFFSSFSTFNQNVATMNTVCSQISQEINAVSDSGGLSQVQYLPLLNLSTFTNYNVSVSRGVILVYLTSISSAPTALISNTNVVSCGSDTLATANESFLASNLVVFQNSTQINLGYLAGNYTFISGTTKVALATPVTIDGGGFVGNSTLSMTFPNGTSIVLGYYNRNFVYNSSVLIGGLSTGNYNFYLTEQANSAISVNLPVAKT